MTVIFVLLFVALVLTVTVALKQGMNKVQFGVFLCALALGFLMCQVSLTREGFKVKRRRKRQIKKNFKQPSLDLGGTFMEAYQSLDKKQIKDLTFDTQQLLDTQKTLVQTLRNMAPALKQGKEIIDTFKNYFTFSKTK